MTIKEMLKKIEAYNEVAEMLGTERAELRFVIDGWMLSEKVEDYKSFVKYVRHELIDEIASLILKCNEYEFHKVQKFEIEGYFGGIIRNSIEFFIAIK